MAEYHPEAILPNLDLVGVFGRYDDLYCLIGTTIEDEMWAFMKKQFEEDLQNMNQGKAISLLAKWIKTADSKSEHTRKLGVLTAKKLGYSVYNFKRIVRSMRKHISVTESLMSTGKWNEIQYSNVAGRAMMIYRNAFMRHDEERFKNYIGAALAGKEKIHSAVLYPYDIVEKILYDGEDSKVLEAQWRQLPDYLSEGMNAIVMADVSGSMYGRPMAASIGLAIYFAERNKGAYHNLFMTFSEKPETVVLKGETLEQKIQYVAKADWGMNTDLRAAFQEVLDIAVEHDVSQQEIDRSTEEWLDSIAKKLQYTKWYFGHYHDNIQYADAELLYEGIKELGKEDYLQKLGRPKYRVGEKVYFLYGKEQEGYGTISVVDGYGTFGQAREVSYDIMGFLFQIIFIVRFIKI